MKQMIDTLRSDAARRRGLEAGQRALELAERRQRMKSQRSSTSADLARAHQAAQVARQRSAAALAHAVDAQQRSGALHRRLAAAYEAMGESTKAARHHASAERCEDAGRAGGAPEPTILGSIASPAAEEVTDPCPACGSDDPLPVGDRVLVCVDCGHVWQEWMAAGCPFHVWVGRDGDRGREGREQHCVSCGEVRLVPGHQP